MINIKTFRELALSLPDTEEMPHFDLISFRVKKRIFATFHEKHNRAMLKLPLPEQSVFCKYDNKIFFPVPGAWGKGGATFVDMKKVKKDIFMEALKLAYDGVVAKQKKKM